MRMTIKQALMSSLVLLITIALTGCIGFSHPITGQSLINGSLRVINNNPGSVSTVRLYTGADRSGELKWQSYGLTINSDQDGTFTDVPVGTWCVEISGKSANSISIVYGMTTTITRDSVGNLTAGIPMP